MKRTIRRWMAGVIGHGLCLAAVLMTACAQGVDPAGSTNATAGSEVGGGGNVAGFQVDYLTFGLDRIEFLQTVAFGQPVWKFLAFVVYVGLAFTVSRFLDHVMSVWLLRLARRTASKLDDALIGLLHGPIKVVSFVVFLHIGLELFTWPVWAEGVLSQGLKVVVAVSLTYLAVKVVDFLMEQLKARSVEDSDRILDAQLFPVLRWMAKAFVVVVAALVTCQNMGVDITGVLASLSIGGLALGLAAQDTLANLFGAVSVFFDKPFRIGDRIRIDQVDGTVESIGIRSTRVRSLDGFLVTIPNKIMGTATITNISRRPSIKAEFNFGLTYDTPGKELEAAVRILEEVFRSDAKTQDLVVAFDSFGGSALNIKVVHWWGGSDQKEYLAGMQALNLKIKARFETAGLQFAYPSSTIYLRQAEGAPTIKS